MQEEFLQKQNELIKGISKVDAFDPDKLKTVAGVDLAYWKEGDEERAVCCIVVIDFATHEVIEKKQFTGRIGYLHPRHMGIATHASFFLNKPTVGIAKSYFRVDRKTDYVEPENEAGSFTDIVIDGETYGRALRTHQNVRPIFVSVGNYVSLDTACKLALKLTDRESHIPIPTRLADLETHVARENEKTKGEPRE